MSAERSYQSVITDAHMRPCISPGKQRVKKQLANYKSLLGIERKSGARSQSRQENENYNISNENKLFENSQTILPAPSKNGIKIISNAQIGIKKEEKY